jgi:hypothetical protein
MTARRAARTVLRLAWLPALLTLTLVCPGHGEAYVQARKSDGKPIVWQGSTCVGLTPDSDFDAGMIDNAHAAATMQKATTNWSNVTNPCSYFSIQILIPRAGIPVGYDDTGPSVNLVKFVAQNWGHDPGAAAITTVTYSDITGRAFDGDIELNSEYFFFALLPDTGSASTNDTDLENTLTHEYGHLMGLDHTCDDGLRMPTPIDDKGQAIPKCCPDTDPTCLRTSAADYLQGMYPDVVSSTMFNFANPGEVSKRSPEPDDIKGICAIYPTMLSPGVCNPQYDPNAERGCSQAEGLPTLRPGAAERSWALVLLSLAALALLTRAGAGRRGAGLRARRPC